MIARYESGTAGCFILHGNINDRVLVTGGELPRLGRLNDFLLESLLPQFEVVLTYELGIGLRVERGQEIVNEWSGAEDIETFPTDPLRAVRFMTNYLIFCRNLRV